MVFELQVAIIKKEVGLEKARKIAEEIIKRDNYEKQISETIASFTSRGLPPPPIAYVQRPTYSIEQYEVAKKCGLNLPS